MARRVISIRWSLLRNLLLLVAVLSGSILTVTFLLSKETVRWLSRDLVHRTADRTEAELRRFFEPVTTQLRVARDWAQGNVLRCSEVSCLNQILSPVMRRVPQISSVNTGDPDGNGVLLLRDADGWRNREVHRGEWGARVRWTKFDPDMTPVRTWTEDLDYDPRTRPWYWGAMGSSAGPGEEGGGVHWTEPYTFRTTKDPGITASVRTWKSDGTPFVLACDVLLKDVSRFTTVLDVSPRGIAFVVAEDDRLVGLPRDDRWKDEAAFKDAILKGADEVGIPAVAKTVRLGHARVPGDATSFDFECDGEEWWGELRAFQLEGGPLLHIGVAVPESDFLGDLERQRTVILLLTATALIGAIILSILLARRYSRPLEELAAQSERISDLDMEPVRLTPSSLAEVSRLHDAQERMRSALDSFARYVPTEIVRDLLRRGEAAQIGGRVEVLTVLFTDIAGFTRISEGMGPEELTAHMAEYFDMMLRTLQEEKATIDKLIGDAIVAFWGAPNPVPEHPCRATTAVLKCRTRLDALNREWTEQGRPSLPTRFGLATGSVVVGNVGTLSRLHYTVLGDTVNVASRLEGANKIYGTDILAEEGTVKAAGDTFVWRRLDRVAVMGRNSAVNVYNLLGRRGEVPEEVCERAKRYEAALRAYWDRRFDVALEILVGLEGEAPSDEAVRRLIHLCREFLDEPPPDDWDGVHSLTKK